MCPEHGANGIDTLENAVVALATQATVPEDAAREGAYVRDQNATLPPLVRRTVRGDLAQIVADFRKSEDLIYQLTLRDVRVRYKQAALGFAWALLLPAAVVMAGIVIRYAVAYSSGRGLQSAQLAGMAVKAVPWAFFVGCLNTATPSLVANKSLVTKIYFPREVLPLSAVLAQTFDSAIGLILVAMIVPFFGVTLSLQLLWVPVLLGLLWLISLGAGLFLACANLFFRDVKYLVQVFVTFGIFITPVILDISAYGPKLAPFMMLNPVSPILEGLALAVVGHQNLLDPFITRSGFHTWHPWYLAYSAAWAFGGLVLSALFFHRSERRFAEIV